MSSSQVVDPVPMGRGAPGDTGETEKSADREASPPSSGQRGAISGFREKEWQLPPTNLAMFLEASGLEIPQFLLLP